MTGSPTPTANTKPPAPVRGTRLLLSSSVLPLVTIFLGYLAWTAITAWVTVTGNDPTTATGDRWRYRFLDWPVRNFHVLQTHGRAPLPLTP